MELFVWQAHGFCHTSCNIPQRCQSAACTLSCCHGLEQTASEPRPTASVCEQVQRIAAVRHALGLPQEVQEGSLVEQAAMQLAPSAELLTSFIHACAERYQRKSVDPGKHAAAWE